MELDRTPDVAQAHFLSPLERHSDTRGPARSFWGFLFTAGHLSLRDRILLINADVSPQCQRPWRWSQDPAHRRCQVPSFCLFPYLGTVGGTSPSLISLIPVDSQGGGEELEESSALSTGGSGRARRPPFPELQPVSEPHQRGQH